MSAVEFTEHAVQLAYLAEYQDKLDEEVDNATVEYLNAQRYASERLERLRKAIDLRDAMQKARKYVVGDADNAPDDASERYCRTLAAAKWKGE